MSDVHMLVELAFKSEEVAVMVDRYSIAKLDQESSAIDHCCVLLY